MTRKMRCVPVAEVKDAFSEEYLIVYARFIEHGRMRMDHQNEPSTTTMVLRGAEL